MNWKDILPVVALVAGLCSAAAIEGIPNASLTGGFALGCQAWTWNRFTVFEAIDKTAACGGKVIELYPGQRLSGGDKAKFDHNSPDEAVARVREHLAKAGVRAVNYGVVDIPGDETGARRIFDFARKLGIRAITTESTAAIDTIEKLAKEYDIRVGFHNHPRRLADPGYKVWDPNYILELVRARDPRLGAAVDTGHWARSSLKPLDCLRILKGRIVSAHLKDLNEFGKPGAHDVPFGTGVNDIKAILDELKSQGFAGNISIEYEHNWDNSMPEVAQCIGFVRGYGAAQGEVK